MLVDQLLESARIGRQPGLRPARSLEAQLVVQKHAQLLWRAEIDPLAGVFVALGLELPDALVEITRHLGQVVDVDPQADAFHAGQHPDQRMLDTAIKIEHRKALELWLDGARDLRY